MPNHSAAPGKGNIVATVASLLLGTGAALCSHGAQADNFGKVRYDGKSDELVVTMLYRGTNPDHEFTLQWGTCRRLPNGKWEIVAEVLDTQASDAARQDYTKTIRVPLGQVDCRPVKLTLRTAPRFYYTLRIPSRPRQ